jgi:hypothetical protein
MRYDGWFLGWRVKKAISFPIIVIKKDLIEARADPGAEAIKEALIDFFQKAKAKKESLTNQDQKNQVDLVVLKLKDAIRNPLKSKYNLDIDQIAKDNYQ